MILFLNVAMSRFALSIQTVPILDRPAKSHCLQDGTHNTGIYNIFIEFSGKQGEQKSTHPYST